MPPDDEEAIIERIARRILEKAGKAERPRVKGYRRLDASTPHGVYVYDKGSGLWLPLPAGGAFKPYRDGFYAVYFDNTRCPACRVYDAVWYAYVELVGRRIPDTEFVVVLCEWFSGRCGSRAAAESFREYGVRASPTTVLLRVEGGEIAGRRDLRGVRGVGELARELEEFRKAYPVR